MACCFQTKSDALHESCKGSVPVTESKLQACLTVQPCLSVQSCPTVQPQGNGCRTVQPQENVVQPQPQYTLDKVISKTLYGQVLRATRKIPHCLPAPCVIKMSSLTRMKLQQNKENPREEARILEYVSRKTVHPNIIQHVDQFVLDDNLYHVLEYFPGQELFDYVVATKTGLTEAKAKIVFKQLISAVKFLHRRRVAHLDISLENILIHPNSLHIKLIDFGAALILPSQCFDLIGFRGKLAYMAPETYAGQKFNGLAADIYSCGTVLFLLLFAAPAYQIPAESDPLFKRIISQNYHGRTYAHKQISDSAVSLLKSIIAPEQKRCSLSDIENHPWMQ